MANIELNSFILQLIAERHTKACSHVEGEMLSIAGTNVRDVIRELEKQFPGISPKLQSGVAVAIDGEIFSDALLQPLEEDSEVYFLPAIEGG